MFARAKLQLPATSQRLLVSIGLGLVDFVEALGALKTIRAAFPGARITGLVGPACADLAKLCPYLDFAEACAPLDGSKAKSIDVQRLRASNFDLALVVDGGVGLGPMAGKIAPKAQIAAVASAHPNRLTALDEGLSIYGLPRPFAPELGWVRQRLRDPPRLQPSFYNLPTSYLLLAPSTNAPSPPAMVDFFRVAIERALRQGQGVAVVGSGLEHGIGAMLGREDRRVLNLCARADVTQIISLIERAAFVLGDDAFALSVARIFGKRGAMMAAADAQVDAFPGAGAVCLLRAPAAAPSPALADAFRRTLSSFNLA